MPTIDSTVEARVVNGKERVSSDDELWSAGADSSEGRRLRPPVDDNGLEESGDERSDRSDSSENNTKENETAVIVIPTHAALRTKEAASVARFSLTLTQCGI
jgi:hypothetical protein